MRLHRLIDPVWRLRRSLIRRPAAASGVLLVSAGGLGDTVMLSVVLPRFLDLARPGETVEVLLRADAARMGFLFPSGVGVRAVDFNRLRQPVYRKRVLEELYRAHFRLVIHTDYLRHPDLDEALALACAAPESAAMAPRPSAKFATRLAAHAKRYSRLYDSGPPHTDKVLRLAGFARFLTGREAAPPVMRLAPEDRPPVVALDAPTVIFQPFSAVTLKQSAPDMWRRIIQSLPDGWRVRIAGHPSDLDKNPAFRPLLDLPGVSFEGAPFAQLAGILQGARAVVSVDTACMHLAAILGVPTLCLASSAYVGEIVPYHPSIMPDTLRVLNVPMACQGCLGACSLPPQDGMYPCVAALDPDRVVAAFQDLIGGQSWR